MRTFAENDHYAARQIVFLRSSKLSQKLVHACSNKGRWRLRQPVWECDTGHSAGADDCNHVSCIKYKWLSINRSIILAYISFNDLANRQLASSSRACFVCVAYE